MTLSCPFCPNHLCLCSPAIAIHQGQPKYSLLENPHCSAIHTAEEQCTVKREQNTKQVLSEKIKPPFAYPNLSLPIFIKVKKCQAFQVCENSSHVYSLCPKDRLQYLTDPEKKSTLQQKRDIVLDIFSATSYAYSVCFQLKTYEL